MLFCIICDHVIVTFVTVTYNVMPYSNPNFKIRK